MSEANVRLVHAVAWSYRGLGSVDVPPIPTPVDPCESPVTRRPRRG